MSASSALLAFRAYDYAFHFAKYRGWRILEYQSSSLASARKSIVTPLQASRLLLHAASGEQRSGMVL